MTSRRRALMALVLVLAWSQTGYRFYSTNEEGVFLRWYVDDVPVNVDKALCEDLPAPDTWAAIQASLDAWNRVPCSHPGFQAPRLVEGVSPFTKAGTGESGSNLIIFENTAAWLADNPELKRPMVIALTTLFYDPGTGEVRSYALEVNEDEFEFAVLTGPDGDKVDVANTITHELGHVLALDHSENPQAAMYPTAGKGETSKRSLTTDDTDGLCTLYSEEYADVTPDGGNGGGSGCSGGGHPASGLPLGPAFLGLAAWVLARRRTRSP